MASKSAGQYVYNGFLQRGFSPVQAAVLAGNMQQESGFNPDAYNAKEDATGGLQWRLDRKTGLEGYAKATGRPSNDIDAQMDWVVQEMLGPEAKNAKAFLAANDVASANSAIKKYIRWGDNSDNARLQNAMSYTSAPNMGAAADAAAGVAQAAPAAPSGGGFVNPTFGNDAFALPSAPSQPVQAPIAPQDTPVAAEPVPAAMGVPALSDDDLFKQFMPEGAPVATAQQTGGTSATQADDDLLKMWASPEAAAKPFDASAAQNAVINGVEDPGIPSPDMRTPMPPEPEGNGPTLPDLRLVPGAGPVLGLMGYNGQPQKMGEGYTPSMVPALDPLNAFASKTSESIPVVGPWLRDTGNQVDAGINNLLTGQNSTPADRARINAADQAQYPVATGAGEAFGTVAPFIAAGGTTLGQNLLGMAGGTGQRVAMGAGSGALISGADTLARGGTMQEAGQNALIGGAVGAGAPIVGNAVNNLIRPAVEPRVAQLAQMARDQFGINIGPGQISTNPTIKFLDSVVNKLPLSGGTANREAQAAAFNRAVSNTFGEDVEAITPDVLQAARNRIGSAFDNVAAQTPSIPQDRQFANDLLSIGMDAQQALTNEELAPIGRQIGAVMDKFQQGNGTITGDVYQVLTRKDAPLSRAMQSPNPNIRFYAGQVRDALDGALERAVSPDVLADLRAARSQYKAMKTIEDLSEKAPTGDISPALLMGAVRKSYPNMAYGGGGDLADLARIGQQFLKAPPSSGTAERLMGMQGLAKVAGAAGGIGGLLMNPGLVIPAAATGAAALATGAGAGAILRSPQLANALINNGLRGVQPAANALLAPAAASLGAMRVKDREPIEVIVNGGANTR